MQSTAAIKNALAFFAFEHNGKSLQLCGCVPPKSCAFAEENAKCLPRQERFMRRYPTGYRSGQLKRLCFCGKSINHMIRTTIANLGRIALLLVVALFAFAYLASGLDKGKAEAAARLNRSTEPTEPTEPMELSSQAEQAINLDADLSDAVAELNACFENEWLTQEIDVAEQADWLTVCRRISLAMVGTGLSLEEIRNLELVDESQRIGSHLQRLIDSPRFHDYWAERFTRVYVGAEDGPFIAFRRRRFRSWLSDSFATNRRYDEIVRSLVTANGFWTDRPEVNFLTVTLGSNEKDQPDPIRLAARTTRAFLGLRIDCLQCHNDFLGNASLGNGDELREGKQTDFHALAAFYSTARLNGLQGIRDETHPYKYTFLNADEMTTVEPAVPYLGDLMPSEGSARDRLATWLTHAENKQAARAIVNRVWALMFGRSLTDAVDNIPLDAELHPAIDFLADDFVDHGFDLRRLIRLIAYSRPYQIDSAADFEITQQHEQAWAVYPLTRLRPEQVAGSVIQAARVKTVDRDSSLLIQLMKFGGVNDFVTRYGDIGEDEFDQDNVTITQRLIMLNGKLVSEYSNDNPVLNSSSHILMFAKRDEAVVNAAYLCVLNRLPDAEERTIFTKRMVESRSRKSAVIDLFWVLLNSSELAWNH